MERRGISKVARLWDEERTVLLLLGAAFLAYLAYYGGTSPAGSDTADYQAAAQALAEGWEEILDRVPGYPLLLLVTGAQDGPSLPLFLVQVGAHLSAVLIAVRIARRMGVAHRCGIALAVAMLLPPVVGPAVAIGTEGPTEFLLVSAAWMFTRWYDDQRIGWLLGLGLTVGAAAWIRPSFTLWVIPVTVLVAWFSTRSTVPQRIGAGASVAAPAIALVGLLVAINLVRFHYPTTTPMAAWHLSTRTALYLEDLPPSEEPLRSQLIEARNLSLVEGDSHTGLLYMWAVRPVLYETSATSNREVDQRMLRLNLRLIATNPLDYLAAVAAASSTYVLPAGTVDAQLNGTAARMVWAPMHLLLFGVFLAQLCVTAGLAVLRRVPRRTGSILAFLYATVLYNGIISTMTEVGSPRHRIPTDLLAMIALAVGLTLWAEARRSLIDPGPFHRLTR